MFCPWTPASRLRRAAASASAIVLVAIRLQPGESTDGAVFFEVPEKKLGEGRLIATIGEEAARKVFLGFKSRAAAKKAYLQHIPRRFFGGMISMSVQMMRAMLGQEPAEKLATGLELSAIVL